MRFLKRLFKQNSHNFIFKFLAGFGRSLNRLYENRNHDLKSNGELTVIKKLLKFKPSVFIDGGANIGKYSILISSMYPNCKIYSFEPVNDTFKKLKSNTKDFANIIPINKGLYKNNCNMNINVFSSNTHSSIYEIQGISYQSNKKEIIELVSGDNFMEEENLKEIDFLKIDIEGAEFDAILGFEKHFKEGKIKAVQFEYGYINITTKKLLVDYYNYFENKGYLIGKIFPKTVEFRKYEFKHEDFIGPNFIAVKKTETELIKELSNK